MSIWEKKYIKYKNKYLGLQDLMGGGRINFVYNNKSYSFILNNDNIKTQHTDARDLLISQLRFLSTEDTAFIINLEKLLVLMCEHQILDSNTHSIIKQIIMPKVPTLKETSIMSVHEKNLGDGSICGVKPSIKPKQDSTKASMNDIKKDRESRGELSKLSKQISDMIKSIPISDSKRRQPILDVLIQMNIFNNNKQLLMKSYDIDRIRALVNLLNQSNTNTNDIPD